MQSIGFYHEATFGDAFRAKVGSAVMHTSPPPPSLHGTCTLPAVSTTVHWAVDPAQTVLHLLFLSSDAKQQSGHHQSSWDKPFVSRKWLVEFPTEVIGCGVSTVSSSTGGTGGSHVLRVVWVSSTLSVEVLSFSIQRAFDESEAIIVEPLGTARSTGPLAEIKRAFSNSSLGTIHAAVAQNIVTTNAISVLILTDGWSLWSVVVDMQGEAVVKCVIRSNASGASPSHHSSSSGGWSILQRWNQQASGTGGGSASAGRRGIIGLCSVPNSESFIVVNASGAAVLLPSVEEMDGSAAQQSIFQFPSDCMPTMHILMKTFIVHDSSATSVEETSGRHVRTPSTFDVISVGSHAQSQAEHVWWHRVRTTVAKSQQRNSALPAGDASILIASVDAPTRHALVQSLSSTEDTLAILWRDRASPVGRVPSSIASALGRRGTKTGAPRATATLQQLTLEPVPSNGASLGALSVGRNTLSVAVTTGADDMEHIAAVTIPMTEPRHDTSYWISFAYTEDLRVNAALLFDADTAPAVLHSPILVNDHAACAVPTCGIPFSSSALCSITADVSSAAQTSDDVAAFEGLGIVASHEDGLQTYLNLLSDAVNSTSTATTLGGFHELATAARIYHHAPLHRVTADGVRLCVQRALCEDKPMLPLRVLCHPPQFARSRWFVNQAVGLELLMRTSYVMTAYIAWVAHDGCCDPDHQDVQKVVRESLEILCGGLNAASGAGSRLPALAAYNFSNHLVMNVLENLLNWRSQSPVVHAVDVAMQFWGLGGVEGWHSSASWTQALRNRFTLMQHMTILRLLESSRTTSSAEITAMSFNVASNLNAIPSEDALSILSMLSESLSAPVVALDFAPFLEAHTSSVGSVYRMILLRRMLPRGSVHHSLLSANAAANSFLPDLVSLMLSSSQTLGPTAPFTMAVNALVADVYVLLARSALGDGNLSEGMRWVNMSLSTSRDTVMDTVQRCLAMAADLVFAEHWFNELVHLPLGDCDALMLLTAALIHCLQRGVQTLRTAGAQRAEIERQSLYNASVAVVRFLIRRHAFGQAARLAYDVARVVRTTTAAAPAAAQIASLVLVEQLLGLSLSSVECINDVDALQLSPVNPSATGAPNLVRGSLSGKPYFCRSDIPMIERGFMEASLELRLLQVDHHLDGGASTDQDYGEDVSSTAAGAYALRLLRALLSARLWNDALMYAELTIPEKIPFVLQCQAVDLLDDPHHQLLMAASSKTDGLATTSSFAPTVDAWQMFVAECITHSTAETSFVGLTAALAVTLKKNHSLVPTVLKEALRRLRPSLLLQLLLNVKVTPAGCDVGEIPIDVALDIFDVASSVLNQGANIPDRLKLSAGVLDRCVELARDIRSRRDRFEADAEKFILLAQREVSRN